MKMSTNLVSKSYADLLVERVFPTAISHNDNIYLVGGCGMNGAAMTVAEVLDLESNIWKSLPTMPTAKAGCAGVAIDDKILTLGGICGGQTQVDAVEAFDVGAQVWTAMQPLKEPLQGITPKIRGDKVLIVGGLTSQMKARSSFYCYDIRTNKWQNFPDMPSERFSMGVFLINDMLYTMSGRSSGTPVVNGPVNGPVDTFEVFDLKAFKWRSLPSCPSEKRVFPSFFETSSVIGILAGLHEDPTKGFTTTCDFFDLETESWFSGPKLDKARGDCACGVIDDHLVIAGGFGLVPETERSVEVCSLTALTSASVSGDNNQPHWTPGPSMKGAHASCGIIHRQQTEKHPGLFLFGGMVPRVGCSSASDCITISA